MMRSERYSGSRTEDQTGRKIFFSPGEYKGVEMELVPLESFLEKLVSEAR